MDAEFKAKWIAALRSGEYKQFTGSLTNHNRTSYCCLGVACDLLSKEGVGYWTEQDPDRFDSFRLGSDWDSGLLPGNVAEVILGDHVNQSGYLLISIKDVDQDAWSSFGESLSGLNDAGFTFDQIADVIDYFF